MRKRIKKKIEKKLNIERITEALDVPKEIVLNIPMISLAGNKEIVVENFNGILEYGENTIRLNTKSGILAIEGKKLEARSMTNESIKITGYIQSVSFGK